MRLGETFAKPKAQEERLSQSTKFPKRKLEQAIVERTVSFDAVTSFLKRLFDRPFLERW